MEDGGRNLLRAKGLFRNLTREGVLAYVSRWIKNGRLGLDLGKEREKAAAGTVAAAAAQPWPAVRGSPARAKLGLWAMV